MLHPVGWSHTYLLGANYSQLARARRHVLVLLPERTRHPGLVERMDHASPNCPVRDRPR